MKSDRLLQNARVEKLIREAGAIRVSKAAIELMNEYLSTYALEIGKVANDLAKHSGRVTVKEEDIVLSVAQHKD